MSIADTSSTPTEQRQGIPLVAMHGISKAYPGCLANDKVDLHIRRGQIHALLGENGAGKSTLVKILYGLLRADSGHIEWQGERVNIGSPARARELGIALVFQHFSLFESLSVLENIALGMGVAANPKLKENIIQVSRRYGLPLEPDRQVYSLSVGERQRIEIVRCLLQNPKLLVMDEPTSVLTPQEVNDLFVTLKRLASEGVAILYISHKLNEIKMLCDEATILRDGKKVATANPQQSSEHQLASLMMGDELVIPAREKRMPTDKSMLQLVDVSVDAMEQHGMPLHGINLQVHSGEVVGIAGVAGNGQDELLQVISGEHRLSNASSLLLSGVASGGMSPGLRRVNGLCCVPEERLGHAAVPSMSLAENAFLTAHRRQSMRTAGLLSFKKRKRFAQTVIDRFNVQCNGVASTASSLSGGNLQKFIVGREIEQQPDVFVVAQPTWGVDAGAATAIRTALQKMAADGAAVLVISQDIDELLLISDRIGALCAGRLSDLYPTDTISVQQLGVLMGGGQLADGAVA